MNANMTGFDDFQKSFSPCTVQLFNSCTSRQEVYQCLVAQLDPWITCQKIIQEHQ